MEFPISTSRIITHGNNRYNRFCFIRSCKSTLRFSTPEVPTPLSALINQLRDATARNHDQDMLATFIHPAPTSGFHPVNVPFPGKVQGRDHTIFIKPGSNFDGLHDLNKTTL